MTESNQCPHCTTTQAGIGEDKCKLLQASYVFAGLAMMLNIRLSYSSAPYALIRFRLPENLFSVFVRRMASALELWCLPSMLLGNLMEYSLKGYYKLKDYQADWNNNGNLKDNISSTIEIKASASGNNKKDVTIKNLPHVNDTFKPRQYKFFWIVIPSIISQWLNFLTYVILLVVYLVGGDSGHLTLFYLVIAISGVVFGINMVLLYAVDWNYIPVYMVGENSFPIVTSFIHYVSTLIFGNRRKWNSDFLIVFIDIGVAIIISLVAAVLWTVAYGVYRNTQKDVITYTKGATDEGTTITKAISGSVTIKNAECKDVTAGAPASASFTGTGTVTVTKNTGPGNTPASLSLTTDNAAPTLAETNGTPNCTVTEDTSNKKLTIKYKDSAGANKCIEIKITKGADPIKATVRYGHIFTESFDTTAPHWEVISPTLMVIVGMGLVYAIYPGIAPGMIVPFYLVDKIEMVLLIATFFPPIIVATLQKVIPQYSPKTRYAGYPDGMGGWRKYEYSEWGQTTKIPAYTSFYHAFDVLIVIKITLAIIFIYSLHYRESNVSRAIVNQPKMSTILSILFYMCHECLLALGFPGVIGNNGSTYVMLPAQYIGALFMIFLAFYSEGYIIEYKSHDPAQWPTDVMWYLYGYYQFNPDFFIMIKFNVCSDGYCDFK